MAKIDTTKIPGYAEMTIEQRLAALEAYDEETTGAETETEKLRKALSKANSEAADYKRQLRARQTDDEVANAEREQRERELQEKYDALLRKETVRGYYEKYRKMGYDEKLAEDTAQALADGDTERVLANGEKFRADFEKSVRADLTKRTPKPENGGSGTVYQTKADIFKIKDAAERQKAIAENIELFSSKE